MTLTTIEMFASRYLMPALGLLLSERFKRFFYVSSVMGLAVPGQNEEIAAAAQDHRQTWLKVATQLNKLLRLSNYQLGLSDNWFVTKAVWASANLSTLFYTEGGVQKVLDPREIIHQSFTPAQATEIAEQFYDKAPDWVRYKDKSQMVRDIARAVEGVTIRQTVGA